MTKHLTHDFGVTDDHHAGSEACNITPQFSILFATNLAVWSNNSYPPFLSRLRPATTPFGMYPCVLRALLLTRIRHCFTIGSHLDDICGEQ